MEEEEGIVVETGSNTQIGQIAKMLQEDETITSSSKKNGRFWKKISYLIIVICAILFAVGLLREKKLYICCWFQFRWLCCYTRSIAGIITIALARGARQDGKKKCPHQETSFC
jgi:Ca2+-transporting ATPase